MQWTIKISKSSAKSLAKINAPERKKIIGFIEQTLSNLENPRSKGKALKGGLSDLWRYRVGNYRLICELQDKNLVVLVVTLGHRKQVYQKCH